MCTGMSWRRIIRTSESESERERKLAAPWSTLDHYVLDKRTINGRQTKKEEGRASV